MNSSGESAAPNLRELPSVDEILRSERISVIRNIAGERRLTAIVRDAVGELRNAILKDGGEGAHTRDSLWDRAINLIEANWNAENGKRTRRVINATGVVIHTNLGRAPLSKPAIDALVREASGYCTVEFDLAAGSRGKRGERAETLLCQLTGAESAIVVNNCAAAAFLVLSVLAAEKEVVISRGELVEIGGDFRVPDVLARSGAVLREVGTTNRTKIADFERAVGERTAMLLRVHPSNYKITGFTAMPGLREMAQLAREKNIVLYEDAGSGALVDLAKYGLADEPVIADSVAAGVDVVSFSGDKLLGGPQAGLIVGRRDLIDLLRRAPLYRALRVSKLIYAALEATLEAFARSSAETDVPVLKMLSAPAGELHERIARFADKLSELAGDSLNIELISGESVVGGGTAPEFHPATSLISVKPASESASALERKLRMGDVPVITRLQDGRVLIDMRTVPDDEEGELLTALAAASGPA